MPEMTQEQMDALQEKMKNMSPEELKQFQKQNCIFCQIIEGKVSSRKIYEDDLCLAILDINPANPGHILLLPKEHYAIMPLIPVEELKHLAMVTKALSHILLKVLKVGGTKIFIANGAIAGQRAQHFMLHIIPRKEKDGLAIDIPKNKITKTQINEIRIRLKAKVDSIFGKTKEEVMIERKPEVIKPEVIKEVIEEEPEKKKEKKKPAKKIAKKKKPKEKEPEVTLDDIAELIK
ncbi:HIT domain-containing protein [Candidatus Woesearchaeota archaeon]|nr:HIT domain-containing protein [Candidatus Woesearchaeota archaeon]